MVANLLSNADKYGGGATRIVAVADGQDRVAVSVVDQGAGVPAEFQGRLFERFSRDVASARQSPGTGLGLFITRELVRANGGDVGYRAGSPSGSVFTLTLPRGTAPDPASAWPSAQPATGSST